MAKVKESDELDREADEPQSELAVKAGDIIRRLRKQADMTQGEVAKQIGLERGAYSEYERGIRAPNLKVLADIAAVHGRSVTDLIAELTGAKAGRDAISAAHGLFPLPLVNSWDGSWPLKKAYPELYISRDIASKSDCILIVMPDSSMHPYIHEGDLLVVNPLARRPKSQEVVVVRTGNDLLVRQMKRVHKRRLLLAAHERIELDESFKEEYELVGTVIAIAERKLKPLVSKLQLSPSDWLDLRSDKG
jgi:transcriptional regulator with XRE-family HTH domain